MHSSTERVAVADFQAHVPERVENGFGDALAPRRLFIGKQKQQIDVGARREQPAAVTADRNHAHAFGRRRIVRAIKLLGRDFVGDRDDRIHQPRKRFSAATPCQTAEQFLLGVVAAFVQRGFQPLRERVPDIRNSSFEFGRQCRELSPELGNIDEVGLTGFGPAAAACARHV